MIDEEDPKPASRTQFPRDLEPMSLEALAGYIRQLETEIQHVKTEIDRKETLKNQAEGIFKD